MRKWYNGAAFGALAMLAVACGGNTGEAVEATDAQAVEEVAAEASYMVEAGSVLKWEGFKTYSDGKHFGTVNLTEGSVTTKGSDLVGGKFTFDLNSINSLDMKPEDEYRAKLIGHLMSPDFFDVANHPTASFEITGVEAAADEAGNTHKISGNLSIRGITKNISFPAHVMMHEGMVHIKAPTFTINRTDWGVQYGSANGVEVTDAIKDKLIDNNIKFEFDLKANKA